ncbi:Smr domain-containing protein [Psidium guajava]|nr:Smr domain-containing protein [Psidium guajava]
MNLSTSSQQKKTSHSRGKSTGWAAFDLKHRQGHALKSEIEHDPFPPISRAIVSPNPCQNLAGNNNSYKKPFSAVLRSSIDFPGLAHNGNEEKQLLSEDSSNVQGTSMDLIQESCTAELKKLKELHSWAENELIEDIVEALDNDFVKASTLLEGMLSAGLFEGDKESKRAKQNTSSQDSSHDELMRNKDFSSGKTLDFSNGTDTLNNDFNSVDKYMVNETCLKGKTYDDSTGARSILAHLKSLPLEPEWEEQDVYLRFRKDAIRVLRSASQHSRAARNAFVRGDHSSAQHHSLKAREEWLVAERLNDTAAKDILSIRNSNNDIWTLDLHGLHKTEAVQALKERLRKLELQVPSNRSVSSKRLHRIHQKNGVARSSSVECLPSINEEKLDKPQSGQRPLTLQVITGVGNHSQMQASLPTAVRSFLNEEGYRFDDTRPGVITVRLKFRQN